MGASEVAILSGAAGSDEERMGRKGEYDGGQQCGKVGGERGSTERLNVGRLFFCRNVSIHQRLLSDS